LNALLLTPFKGAGIAIGSSIAAWYNVWLLVKNLQYQNFNLKLISNFTAKTLFCSAIMSLVILVVRYYYEEYFYSSSYLIKISMLLGSIFIGIVVFVLQSLYIRLHNILLIKK
jgi:putative peptidoglycan lipid II flippase